MTCDEKGQCFMNKFTGSEPKDSLWVKDCSENLFSWCFNLSLVSESLIILKIGWIIFICIYEKTKCAEEGYVMKYFV